MTTEDKLLKAKLRLILNQPFFATLALGMTYTPNDSIETASCNGTEVKYNPIFIDSLPIDQIECLLAHEMLHFAMLHHLRIEDKDHTLWNNACDYAINPILKNSGYILPEGGLIDSRFNNCDAESIYRILVEERQKQQNDKNKADDSAGSWGQIEKPNDQSKSKKEQEQEAQQRIVEAVNVSKQAGKSNNMIETFIEKLLKPCIDWREILNRFVAEISKNDYTWTRPSKRYIPIGLYLPTLESTEVGKIVFVIDTSGSCNNDILNVFFTELREISTILNFPITAIHCDTKVQLVEEIEEDSIINPKGGGGTSFIPPFELIENEISDAQAIVYLTDGRCSRFPNEPNIPTIWAIYDNNHFKPPFGEVIEIK